MCFKVAERWLSFQVSWLIQAECEDGARTGGKGGRDKEGEEAGPVGSLQGQEQSGPSGELVVKLVRREGSCLVTTLAVPLVGPLPPQSPPTDLGRTVSQSSLSPDFSQHQPGCFQKSQGPVCIPGNSGSIGLEGKLGSSF